MERLEPGRSLLISFPTEDIPGKVAVNGAGNVYISDGDVWSTVDGNSVSQNAIKEWKPATQQISTLVPPGPYGESEDVTVNGSGNVYMADWTGNVISEWNAATQAVTTLASTISAGVLSPHGVAVDALATSTSPVGIPWVTAWPWSCREHSCRAGRSAKARRPAAMSLAPVVPGTEPLTGIYRPRQRPELAHDRQHSGDAVPLLVHPE